MNIKWKNPHWVIGKFLAYQRKLFGIDSQTNFADSLGISRFRLSDMEAGRTPLKLKTAWKACELLDIHPDFLISSGKLNPGPFTVIDEGDRVRIEKLIGSHSAANFIDAWPAIRSVVLEATPQDAEKTEFDILTGLSNTTSVKSEIEKLAVRLKRATSPPGKKAELARHMKVAPARVSEWLSGQEPGGEYALKLLRWVSEQEHKNKVPGAVPGKQAYRR